MIISRPTKRSNINISPNCHNNDHRHKRGSTSDSMDSDIFIFKI
jgi:hypothetical protein